MVMHRNLGPFDTTAIGLGEMPLTIENNLGWAKGIETIHAALDAISTPPGPTTARVARSRPARSWCARRWTAGRARRTRC